MNIKIYGYIYILFLSTISISQTNNTPIFISLGKDCEPAWNLKYCNLRKKAFPFDWNGIKQFSDICHIIENKFDNFCNPVFLKHNGTSILHTLYNIHFRHDFPVKSPEGKTHISDPDADIYIYYHNAIVDNFLDYMDDFTQKYTRRIDRFLKKLNETTPIIFIRTGNITLDEVKQFTSHMNTHYPRANYTLLVVHRNNLLNYDWQIPYVYSHYLTTKHPKQYHVARGWADPKEWKNLFITLGYLA